MPQALAHTPELRANPFDSAAGTWCVYRLDAEHEPARICRPHQVPSGSVSLGAFPSRGRALARIRRANRGFIPKPEAMPTMLEPLTAEGRQGEPEPATKPQAKATPRNASIAPDMRIRRFKPEHHRHIVAEAEAGKSFATIARSLGVSPSSVSKAYHKWRTTYATKDATP